MPFAVTPALAGRSRVNLVAFEVEDLIEQALEMSNHSAMRDVNMSVNVAPGLPKIRADRVLLGHARFGARMGSPIVARCRPPGTPGTGSRMLMAAPFPA